MKKLWQKIISIALRRGRKLEEMTKEERLYYLLLQRGLGKICGNPSQK